MKILGKNPLLQGFHPDPSILRVESDYYIATSTFEWWPGVRIHHSKDLITWKLLPSPLIRVSQLDMKGVPDSGGIWAPCLSYSEGTFYLVYTNVTTLGPSMNMNNYVVTTKHISQSWSEPIFLNSSGFDPSFFHDDDGKTYLVNMVWDNRIQSIGGKRFGGIILQEFDKQKGKLLGTPRKIFAGTSLGLTEGPHIYKRNGYYYLMVAEGGTGYDHAVTLARSKILEGPYEVHPHNPVVTSRFAPQALLQKAGHASLVESTHGQWFLAHLCSRPITSNRLCPLGRETALQNVFWGEDDWLYLGCDKNDFPQDATNPRDTYVVETDGMFHDKESNDFFVDFTTGNTELLREFQTLRQPIDCTISLDQGLILSGGDNLMSKRGQTFLARRIDSFSCTAELSLDFLPVHYLQSAGLVCYYNTTNWYYMQIIGTSDDFVTKLREIDIVSSINGEQCIIQSWNCASVPQKGTLLLSVSIEYDDLKFSWSCATGTYTQAHPLHFSYLSDDHVDTAGFTGAFVGFCVLDGVGTAHKATVSHFAYRKKK